jgi:hypothetical protein
MPEGGKPYTADVMQAVGGKAPKRGGVMPRGKSKAGSASGSNATAKRAKRQNGLAEKVSVPGDSATKLNKNMAGKDKQQRSVDTLQAKTYGGRFNQPKGSDNPKAKPMTKKAKREKNFHSEMYF